VNKNSAMGSDRCSKYVKLWLMDVCAAVELSVQPFSGSSVQPTVCMPMVLDRNT
jgi:hypothetical protein